MTTERIFLHVARPLRIQVGDRWKTLGGVSLRADHMLCPKQL